MDKVLFDVTGDPGPAGLLHFTLLRLWAQRKGNRITWEAYNRVGGGRVAVVRAAEALMHQFTPAEQALARAILQLTVRLDADGKVRRVTAPGQLLGSLGPPAAQVERPISMAVWRP